MDFDWSYLIEDMIARGYSMEEAWAACEEARMLYVQNF